MSAYDTLSSVPLSLKRGVCAPSFHLQPGAGEARSLHLHRDVFHPQAPGLLPEAGF